MTVPCKMRTLVLCLVEILRKVNTVVFACLLAIAPITASATDKEVRMLRYSTWGLQEDPDPFTNRYPTVVYLPRGTIIFESKPGRLKGYISVLLQYGHRVQIKEQVTRPGGGSKVSALKPIAGLINAPPTNAIIFQQDILCLRQVNRIVIPPASCNPLKPGDEPLKPVGKGWIFSFSFEDPDSDWNGQENFWIIVKANLDTETVRNLRDRGWDAEETEFRITRNDLKDLETQGYLVLLNTKMPPTLFKYPIRPPIYIACGQKIITEKTLNTSRSVTGAASIEAEIPIWAKFISGIKSQLGLKLEGEKTTENNKSYEITVDTSKNSFLYYFAEMSEGDVYGEGVFSVESTILVEKIFECKDSPLNTFGERITSVRFQVDQAGSNDPGDYVFENPDDYLPVTDPVYEHIVRPVFVSANTAEQYERLFSKIVEKTGIENVALTHFMVTQLNNTCPFNQRKKCRTSIDAALSRLH